MELTKCMASECGNLTTKSFPQYGTFCFQHSYMTKEPNARKSEAVKPVLSEVALINDKNAEFYTLNPKEKHISANIRRAPLPSVKLKLSEFEKINCCLCNSTCYLNDKMKCGHIVCDDCLDVVRTMDCPCCGNMMEGNLLTPFNIEQIKLREREDAEFFGY
jgi:hypothetical protein